MKILKAKEERGSITMFVLIAMLFFLGVAITLFTTTMNSGTIQKKDIKKIQSEYDDLDTEQLNILYEEARQRNPMILPDEFQQVKYIESTGTQWINTKKKFDNNRGIYLDFMLSEDPGNLEFALCGVLNPNLDIGGTRGTWLYSYRNGYGAVVTNIGIDLTRHTISINYLNNGLAMIDENNFQLPNSQFSNNNTMYLFCANHNNTTYIKTKCRIYNAKITQNDEIIADFIPCYTKKSVTDVDGKQCPSGTAGLYDTVAGEFYTNQNQSGDDFTIGR